MSVPPAQWTQELGQSSTSSPQNVQGQWHCSAVIASNGDDQGSIVQNEVYHRVQEDSQELYCVVLEEVENNILAAYLEWNEEEVVNMLPGLEVLIANEVIVASAISVQLLIDAHACY